MGDTQLDWSVLLDWLADLNRKQLATMAVLVGRELDRKLSAEHAEAQQLELEVCS